MRQLCDTLVDLLAQGLDDAGLRRLALDGPDGDAVEAHLPGDGAGRQHRARTLVQIWKDRDLIDGELLRLVRDRCPKRAGQIEDLAQTQGWTLPPGRPIDVAGRATVRLVLEAEVDSRDLVALARIYAELQALAPGARMEWIGAGAGSLWVEVAMDTATAIGLWERPPPQVAGHPVTSLGGGRAPPVGALPDLPRIWSAEQVLAWLKLALSPAPGALTRLEVPFLDRLYANQGPLFAMETGSPSTAEGTELTLPLALVSSLIEADPTWPYLPDDVSSLVLPALLDLAHARLFTHNGALAVEIPPRLSAIIDATGSVDAALLSALRQRCEGGLRLRLGASAIPRFWAARGAHIHAEDGFLVADPETLVETAALGARRSEVNDPRHAAAGEPRILVLLGEPGMGKSTELRRLADVLWTRSRSSQVELLDLREVGSHEHLRQRLGAISVQGPEGWLLLDSFDECLLRVQTLAEALLALVEGWGGMGPRLVICCRTGAWPASLEASLARAVGHSESAPPFAAMELLPLRKEDTRGWVSHHPGQDADAFIAAVDRAGIGVLAARPITLRMLIEHFDGTSLPAGRTELYEQATRRLADEADDLRREVDGDPLRLRHRLTAAGRIATVLLLSSRTHLWLEPHRGPPPGGVALSDVAGPERGPHEIWSMDDRLLDEVARRSALFSAVGTSGRQFDHQTFAEHLAAAHLIAHGFTGSRALRLLWPPGAAEVAPQLHGLAGWLAALDPSALEQLVEGDPRVLLRTDPAALTPEIRARLVERILAARAAGVEAEDVFTDDFHNLWHPGLEAQLVAALTPQPGLDPERSLNARRSAVRMALHTGLHALAPQLMAIALAPEEHIALRTAAADAVAELDATHSLDPHWTRLARGEAGLDPEGDLRGIALATLWPRRRDLVGLQEVLEISTRTNYLGAMWSFIAQALPDSLEASDLPDLIPLFVDRPEDPGSASEERLWERAFSLAWEGIDRSATLRAALVDVAFRLDAQHRQLPLSPDLIGASAERRHRFIDALLADERCEDNTLSMLTSLLCPTLLRSEDLAWVIARYRAADSTRQRINLRDASRLCLDIEDPTSVDLLLTACVELPDLADWWRPALIGPIALGSVEAEAMRHRFERAHPPELEKPLMERVLTRLAQAEENPAWFPDLLRHLALASESRRLPLAVGPSPETLPGWGAADPLTQSRILDCAQRYLEATDPDAVAWFGSSKVPFSAQAGHLAGRLLQAARPEGLSPNQPWWPRWAATFMELSGAWNSPANFDLAAWAAKAAPASIEAGLRHRLDRASSDFDYQVALQRTDAVWTPAVADLLRAEVSREELPVGRRAAALDRWLRHEGSSAAQLEEMESSLSLPVELRARAAIHRFHHHGSTLPADWWSQISAEVNLARAIAAGLNDWQLSIAGAHRDQPAQVVVDLYRWLTAHRDPSAESWRGEGVAIATTGADWQEELRSRLPEWLAQRADQADIEGLEALKADEPSLLWLIGQARATHLRKSWVPLTPREVVDLLFAGPPPDPGS